MTDLAQKQAPQRRGFSLVLSLTIMAMILLMVITLASFLSIEARLASANQLRTQARMQALVSLRLALAHLQQEAGPDRRATYRADILRFAYSTPSAFSPTPVAWKDARNPMWTGVQRIDRPFQPPSWIISGRGDKYAGTQMISLAKPPTEPSTSINQFYFKPISYPLDYWLPWETGYTGGVDSNKIVLVGDATATTSEAESDLTPLSGRPDGRVSLPAVTLPDLNVSGRYCYWVGDEGVKANISLIDPRVQTSTATNSSLSAARRGVGRTGVELLSGFSNSKYQPGDIDSRIRSTDQLKLLPSGPNGIFNDATGNIAKALWPDVTLVSQGLFTDSKWGGLQIDLSTVFEKSDANFSNSEFGSGNGSAEGSDGAITFAYEEGRNINASSRDWQPFKQWPKENPDGNFAPVWTLSNLDIYSFLVPFNTIASTSNRAAIRGPTWSALRDYYRLYQSISTVGGPQINARTHFPNSRTFSASGYPSSIGFLHYSQMYNRSITPRVTYSGSTYPVNTGSESNNFLDFKGYDRIYFYGPKGNSFDTSLTNNPDPSGSFLGPIPTKVSVAPYISRQLLAIGVINDGGIVKLVISPITILHNPYNVKLNVGSQRISFRDMDNWWIDYQRDYNSGLETTVDSFNGIIPDNNGNLNTSIRNWRNEKGIMSILQYYDVSNLRPVRSNKFQSLRFDIPAVTMEPGEFLVFSADKLSPLYNFDLFKSDSTTTELGTMSLGLRTNTGFYGPCLAEYKLALTPNTAQPLTVTRSDTKSLSLQLWTSSYMPAGFRMVHQMVSWPGDTLPTGYAVDDTIYNTCSIVTELTCNVSRDNKIGLSENINGKQPVPRVLTTNTSTIRSDLPNKGGDPLLLGVLDYDMRWPNDSGAFAVFARTNPMAASRRVDASDATWLSTDPTVGSALPPGPYFSGTQYFSATSPSFKFGIRDINNLVGVVDVSGNNAYGGMSSRLAGYGVTSAVFSEVPLTAPLTLAQFTHANFGIYDHEPLYAIGNSFAPAFTKSALNHRYGTGFTGNTSTFPPVSPGDSSEADVSYITNRALFDRYFMSSIGPVYNNGSESKSQASVIDDFVDGLSTLPNPKVVLISSDKEKARTDLKEQTKNHRNAAKYLANNGAFNIHSMSVRAWAAVLAGAKAKALSNEKNEPIANSNNARFPRAVRGSDVDVSKVNRAAYGGNPPSGAWTGLANLDDNQISLLARSIIQVNMWRLAYSHRDADVPIAGTSTQLTHDLLMNFTTFKDVSIRDLPQAALENPYGKLPCAYLGLSQFVNRFHCQMPANGWGYRSGAIQNAIAVADSKGAGLMNRAFNGKPDVQLDLTGSTYSTKPPPPMVRDGSSSVGTRDQIILSLATINPNVLDLQTATQKNYADVKIGAPTSLLQSDILAAIGSSLSVRSDTFTIRAYGDISDKAGSPAAGSCWIEAVVQRIPEFVDNSQDATTAVSSPTNGLGHNPNLLPVNINLGRRFVIISCRILKPNEL